MIVKTTPAFKRAFKKLSKAQKEDFNQAIFLLYGNLNHPRLKVHKLKGKWRNFWSFSINYADRCIFSFVSKNEVLLYDVGSHRVYD